MRLASIALLILAFCVPAVAADGYVVLMPDPAASKALMQKFQRTCPGLADEADFDWIKRCVPEGEIKSLAEIRAIDGDTIEVAGEVIRFVNIDAPETKFAKCDAERRMGLVAKRELQNLLGLVFIKRLGKDKYDRTLAFLETSDGKDIGAIMMDLGLAVPYAGGKRMDWCAPVR
ncbi:MAG: thermonuclease family protein, partial [Mesorhizobium sp.]